MRQFQLTLSARNSKSVSFSGVVMIESGNFPAQARAGDGQELAVKNAVCRTPRTSVPGYKRTSRRPKSTSAYTPESGRNRGQLSESVVDPLATLALPQQVEHWSLTTLREKLIKIGAKVVRHGRYITFQMAETAIPRILFVEILRLIDGLRPATLPP